MEVSHVPVCHAPQLLNHMRQETSRPARLNWERKTIDVYSRCLESLSKQIAEISLQ